MISIDRGIEKCKNGYMKTKNENDFEGKVAKVFSDFFHEILAPFLEDKFNEIDKRFDNNEKEHKEIFQRLDESDKDHEKISRALERNGVEHDEMFVRLDRIEKGLKGHDKRIKGLEAIIAS